MRFLSTFVTLALLLVTAAHASANDEATRASMAELVDSLQVVLPLSLDDRSFSAAENRKTITAALASLTQTGRTLPGHTSPADASFAFLSRSLARDTRAIEDRFAAGKYEQARFLLHEVTENCVACHSRVPDKHARPLGLRLVDDQALRDLPLIERVRLEVATRQFDRALATYTDLFAGPEFTPADLDLMGHIDAYLEVCLRVRTDSCDPAPELLALSKREAIPVALARNIDAWLSSLQRLDTQRALQPDLGEMRQLLAEASDRALYANDRSALVLYFSASGIGNRLIEGGAADLDELAEIYYWLGFIESRVGRSFWPSEGEYLLEAAVRVAPGSEAAARAFALLEEVAAVAYSGSAGNDPPSDVRRRLEALRALIVDAGRLAPPEPPSERSR